MFRWPTLARRRLARLASTAQFLQTRQERPLPPPYDMGDVLVIGGGIGGLTAAIALQRAGIPVRLFEQAPALNEVGAGVSLWPNAMRALATLGLAGQVLGDQAPLERIVIRRRDGTVLLRLREPGRYDEPGICIHRSRLQQMLAASVPTDRVHLDRRLVDLHIERSGVTARFHDGATARGALLIGCDGIHSVVRARLHGDAPARARGYEIWRGVSDVELPRHLLGQSTEWWGAGHRFGLLPGEPGRVYWYATHTTGTNGTSGTSGTSGTNAANGAAGTSAPGTGDGVDRDRLRRLFADWPAPVRELIEAAGDGDLVRTMAADRSVPRTWGRGPVTLLGDAAHPMTPNMGQGACTAIEDAVVLARCLAARGLDPAALRRYEDARTRRTRRIVRQSRRIGRLGQLTNPLLVAARDQVMRGFPERLVDLAQRRVYGYRITAPEPVRQSPL